MLAEHVLGRAHPDDRLMLAAVRALRHELVAPQTVDAAVATCELRRPEPWLTAARTGGPLQRRVARRHLPSLQPGDEEPVRAVPVGPDLKEPGVAGRRERRRRLSEVGGLRPARGQELLDAVVALPLR